MEPRGRIAPNRPQILIRLNVRFVPEANMAMGLFDHLVGASKNARRDDRILITKFVPDRRFAGGNAALGRFNFLSTPRSATPQIPASRAPRRARKPPQPLDRSCHAPCGPTLSKVSCGPPAPGQEMTHPAETYPRQNLDVR